MIYILYGEDDFSLQQALGEIKDDLDDSQALSISTSVLDGQHLSLKELEDNCNSVPFLSSHRLVVVNGLLERFEPKRDKPRRSKGKVGAKKELKEWEALASYIKRMPEATILVLIDGKIFDHNPLLKELSPSAKVRVFPLLRGNNLKTWIQRQVSNEGGNITREAANLLAELIGGNLWAMNNEIQKLVLYTQGRPIGEDDVGQLVSYAQEANIFALVDAIIEGQIKVSRGILHRLYQGGASPTYILTMIARQFRLISLARDLGLGRPRQELRDKLGLMSNYGLDKTLSHAKLYDFDRIRQSYDKLLEADLAIKTGKYNAQLTLELLVSDLCQASGVDAKHPTSR